MGIEGPEAPPTPTASPPSASHTPWIPLALIVLDGLGDRPHPETGGVSPVVAASTPHLDRLLQHGSAGRVVLIGPGVAPESDAGVLALLGYDPVKDSPGRGVLEALGVDVPLGAGDVALRLNFATASGDGAILDSRVGRSLSTGEAKELAGALTSADLLEPEGAKAEVRSTIGHRGILWLHPSRDGPLSPEISNSDPFYERVGGMGRAIVVDHPKLLPVRATAADPAAERTAELVQLFLDRATPLLAGARVNARRALSGRPIANALLLRNAGALPTNPPASFQARNGVPGAAVTEMPVERGIARLLGLEDRFVGPMGPDREKALAERAQATRRAMTDHGFTYVHLKGPDEPGHDGDALRKKEIIEALDRWFFGPFLDGLDLSAHRILVTADHATPCILRAHSDDPVPLLVAGRSVVADPQEASAKFGEPACALGSLGTLRGTEVLDVLFQRGRFRGG